MQPGGHIHSLPFMESIQARSGPMLPRNSSKRMSSGQITIEALPCRLPIVLSGWRSLAEAVARSSEASALICVCPSLSSHNTASLLNTISRGWQGY
jgi:hypothetical protein